MFGILTNERKCNIILKIAIVLILNLSASAYALEPPTKEQLMQYRQDGTIKQRVEQAKAIGNHLVSQELVRRFRYKLERISRELKGKPLYEIEKELAPPPARVGLPTSGTVKVLALLIAFSDYPPIAGDNTESMQSKLFGDGSGGYPNESLRNYYRRSSYNQLEIQGNVLGWYTTSYPRSTVDNAWARDNLIKEALDFYESQGHDFAQYDNDGDGTIDYFIVIWTGPHGAWASFWWGYQEYFSDSGYTLDGKKLTKYSWQWESLGYPGGIFTPLVVIHETGHALGLPDYYDYDDSIGPRGGVGGLDMMDGNWGDHNCFSKFMLDWISPSIFNSGVHLVNLNTSSISKDSVALWPYRVQDSLFSEYFMVQNRFRDPNGNDISYPNDGLLIWHVDSRLDSFGYNFQYNNSFTEHKLLKLMEADGLEEIGSGRVANAGDYYVAGSRFAPDSNPNSNLYDGTASRIYVVDTGAAGTTMAARIHYGLAIPGPPSLLQLR